MVDIVIIILLMCLIDRQSISRKRVRWKIIHQWPSSSMLGMIEIIKMTRWNVEDEWSEEDFYFKRPTYYGRWISAMLFRIENLLNK